MNYPIQEIEGIGVKNRKALAKAGITNTKTLLEMCCDRKGRNAMAKETGVDAKKLLKWANMADLMRIKGVGKQFAELLEASGVDTVKELRKRKAANLATKMAEVNATKKKARRTPTESMVTAWVDAAKEIEPVIRH